VAETGPGRTPAGAASSTTDSLRPPGSGAADDRPVVLFIGTSLTAGYGLEDPEDDAFPALVQDKLDSAGLGFRVVNAGVPGETSAAARRRIGWVVGGQPRLAVVVLEEGGNDARRGLDPDALRRNLGAMVDSVRTRSPDTRVVLVGMEAPPNLGPRYTERFHQVYPAVAREKSVAFLPFLLDGVAGDPTLNQGDRIHPNVRGHRIVAGTVWRVLEPVLEGDEAR